MTNTINQKIPAMPNSFDPHSLHGAHFTATICGEDCLGKVSVGPDTGFIYLCQDKVFGSNNPSVDKLGHKHIWFIGSALVFTIDTGVNDFKLLPSTDKYHTLFTELLEKRGPAWDEDGSYSVIPKAVMEKIAAFMGEIKVFESKNQSK